MIYKGYEMDLSAAFDLAHYGVKGVRKGKRRWTNPDGTLTLAGRIHYGLTGGTPRSSSKSTVGESRAVLETKDEEAQREAMQRAQAKAGIPVTAQRSQPKSELGVSSTTLKPNTLLGEWTDILSEQDKKMKLSEIRKKRAKTAAKKKIQAFHGN